MLHVSAIEPVIEEDPCVPNPCGAYSNPPRRNGDRCDCSCQTGMIGSPPNCHPECIFNNDCPTELACKNQRCVDPCPGLCGIHATCRVRSHIPICVCDTGYQGDPFTQCRRITSKDFLVNPKRPWVSRPLSIGRFTCSATGRLRTLGRESCPFRGRRAPGQECPAPLGEVPFP